MRSTTLLIVASVAILGVAVSSCSSGGTETVKNGNPSTISTIYEPAAQEEETSCSSCAKFDAMKVSGISYWMGFHCAVVFAFNSAINPINADDVAAGNAFCFESGIKIPSADMTEDIRMHISDYCAGFEVTDASSAVALARKQMCDAVDVVDKMFSKTELNLEKDACKNIGTPSTPVEILQKAKCSTAQSMLTNLKAMDEVPDSCI